MVTYCPPRIKMSPKAEEIFYTNVLKSMREAESLKDGTLNLISEIEKGINDCHDKKYFNRLVRTLPLRDTFKCYSNTVKERYKTNYEFSEYKFFENVFLEQRNIYLPSIMGATTAFDCTKDFCIEFLNALFLELKKSKKSKIYKCFKEKIISHNLLDYIDYEFEVA